MSWSDADVKFLQDNYGKAGWSTGALSIYLGKSRNAVIGKADRLGLTTERTSSPPPPRVPASPPKVVPLRPPKRKPKAARIEDLDLAAIPMADKGEGCRFIPGQPAGPDTVFCGREKQRESSYCRYHHALCHRREGWHDRKIIKTAEAVA